MNADEFNEKYKDYLEPGFEGLEFSYPDAVDFLDNVFQDLIRIPGFQYSQIKVKFRSCRFYSNLKSTELQIFIEKELKEILELDDYGKE